MKPEPIWQKWMKDPQKREKLFTAYWIGMIIVQIMLVFGFLVFLWLMWKKHV